MDEFSPTRVIALRLKSIRRRRGLSQQALAARLRDLNIIFDPTVVSRIENHGRIVTLGEFLGFAAALNVSPLALLIPPNADGSAARGDEDVFIGPERAVTVAEFWDWATGKGPLLAIKTFRKLSAPGPFLGSWQDVEPARLRIDYAAELPIVEQRRQDEEQMRRRAAPYATATTLLAELAELIDGPDDGFPPDLRSQKFDDLHYLIRRLQSQVDEMRAAMSERRKA